MNFRDGHCLTRKSHHKRALVLDRHQLAFRHYKRLSGNWGAEAIAREQARQDALRPEVIDWEYVGIQPHSCLATE